MKKYFINGIALLFAITVSAQQRTLMPPTFWENINFENTLDLAKKGDKEYQLIAALYYLDIQSDLKKFRYWIEKAASQNNSEALRIMAQFYYIGDYGFPINEKKAIEYAQKAASLNNVHAMTMIYEAYCTGMGGLPIDEARAFYWAQRGASMGDAYLQFECGRRYMGGIGCPQSEKEGLYWLQKSADQKCIEAQAALIHYYGTAFIKPNSIARSQESRDKVMSVGLDFLINPDINQNTESILLAKGILGEEFFHRKNYKKGISLMREALNSQNELIQFYWRTMNEYAQEVLGTTISELENQ